MVPPSSTVGERAPYSVFESTLDHTTKRSGNNLPDESVPVPESCASGIDVPLVQSNKIHGAVALLERLRSMYPARKKILKALENWAHPGRRSEISESLITSLLFLEREASVQVLKQLKEPRDVIQSMSYGTIKNRSMVIPISLMSANQSGRLFHIITLLNLCVAVRVVILT